LSGGLKRRLNLAIGLLTDPDILLLDEPTAGVDPQSRHFLLESIAGLRADGKTIIYTSHYMDEIEALCERVAIIDAGRILISGSLDQVLREANDGGEIDASLRLAADLPQALAGAWRSRNALQESGRHAYRLRLNSAAEFAAVLQSLNDAGCTVLAASCGQRNLEEVFMHLTRRSLRD
jgi:ABC-2 type transport system ATP-binding protein